MLRKIWAISPGLLATCLRGDPEVLKSMGAYDPALAGQLIQSVVKGKRDCDIGKVIDQTGIQAW